MVLEPQVSPAFAIKFFCNHCNIRFENTSKYVDTLTLFPKNLNQRSLTPSLLRSHVWFYPRIIVSKSHENTSKYVDTVTLFFKNLNQRSLTPRWPLTPCLLKSHVWLYPRIIVSKSHGNTSMYVDCGWIQWWILQFIITTWGLLHIRTYYVHTNVQNEWSHSLLLNSVQARQLLNSVQARQKNSTYNIWGHSASITTAFNVKMSH